MELFTLPNEILFTIFEYINKLDDINRFICSYKNGYMIRDYIRTIQKYTIENPKVLSLYPNLTKLDGFLLLYNKKLFNIYDMPCFSKIENLTIDLPLDCFYQPIYLYLNKYFQTNNNLNNITFIANDYHDGFGTEPSGYCKRFFNIKNRELYILDMNGVREDIDEIIMRKNVINLLMYNNIFDSVCINHTNDKDLSKLLLDQKVKSIKIHVYQEQINNYMKCNIFCKSLSSALYRLENINMIGTHLYYESRFTDAKIAFRLLIDNLYDRKAVNKKMKKLLIPIPASKLDKCFKIFPNVQKIVVLYDMDDSLQCENDLYSWMKTLSLPLCLKILYYGTQDIGRTESYNPKETYLYNNIQLISRYMNKWR
ncbi:Hypothetical protein ORPV_1075 [Orpheovirus IHUMI-LCC2]|uniref:F-box domain-containing protein n=1 Tax=Orpheovirus IHUMI-LCC2 TaxID=2023057 RepID=A0A2I2L693_9VIRU|nr:Hypothetical protein ORPV_1075 [Orpheovirus IHUMI-LCC2]SNW62979.1 Hypothetical protein ORPV_1075 [Orpheovirus IHUMI-LCC2]